MKKLRVGVVGVGHIGTNHARIYSEIPTAADFTAIYDIDSGRANSISRKYGGTPSKSLDEFAERVDAAYVATATSAHYEIARKLLQRGKHLLIEKPIAENAQHATELFFFSSRRRHTRSLCDWSSDVCSSDLSWLPVLFPDQGEREAAL